MLPGGASEPNDRWKPGGHGGRAVERAGVPRSWLMIPCRWRSWRTEGGIRTVRWRRQSWLREGVRDGEGFGARANVAFSCWRVRLLRGEAALASARDNPLQRDVSPACGLWSCRSACTLDGRRVLGLVISVRFGIPRSARVASFSGCPMGTSSPGSVR